MSNVSKHIHINEGVIPSPPDDRDYTVSAAYEAAETELPEEFEVWQPPTANQLSTGNCVAQSIANILECIKYQRTGEHNDYSVGFIYGNRRRNQSDNEGMITRYAIDAMTKEGDVLLSTAKAKYVNWTDNREMPDVADMFETIFPDVWEYADKIQGYIRFKSLQEIKEFMYKYKIPVVITAKTAKLTGDDKYTGSHAVACYGWKGKELKYHNSWGTNSKYRYGLISYGDVSEEWGLIPVEKTFTDVQEERWSADAINEAAMDGIILGYPDGTFKPEQALSREEMAVMYQRIKRQVKKMIVEGM